MIDAKVLEAAQALVAAAEQYKIAQSAMLAVMGLNPEPAPIEQPKERKKPGPKPGFRRVKAEASPAEDAVPPPMEEKPGRRTDVPKTIVEALSGQSLTAVELINTTGLSKSSVYAQLDRLYGKRMIERDGEAWRLRHE